MITDYPVSIKSLGGDFEKVRLKASELAERHDCMFWWKPETESLHYFVFTRHSVAIRFVTYLESEIVGKNDAQVLPSFVSSEEVRNFADHCVYIRSVYEYARRLFLDSSDEERRSMESVAPRFFDNLALVLQEFTVLAASRIIDPWIDGNNENFVVELFANAFARIEPLNAQLRDLLSSLERHRVRLDLARNKLTAHADRKTISAGKPLGAATWKEWEQFWRDLDAFVSLIHQHTFGSPFKILSPEAKVNAEVILEKIQR